MPRQHITQRHQSPVIRLVGYGNPPIIDTVIKIEATNLSTQCRQHAGAPVSSSSSWAAMFMIMMMRSTWRRAYPWVGLALQRRSDAPDMRTLKCRGGGDLPHWHSANVASIDHGSPALSCPTDDAVLVFGFLCWPERIASQVCFIAN